MKLNLQTSNGLLALTDEANGSTRTVHKYAVVTDRRRADPFWGKWTDTDLSKLTVEHLQSVTIHEGHVVGLDWDGDAEASQYLLDRGATIVLDEDDVAEPDEAANGLGRASI